MRSRSRGLLRATTVGCHLIAFVVLSAVIALSGGMTAMQEGVAETRVERVLVTTVATEITPVVADHVEETLGRAQREGHAAYVIELDTPGGLAESMRAIVQDILASETPVIVYVSPQGARAASAGAVITLAAHAAVMAPGTSIGAATPVGMQGEDLGAKVINDAAAHAESLARLRGRDVEFAGAMVREGRSLDVSQAVRTGVVDAQASSLREALSAVDGRQVRVAGDRTVTLRTAVARADRAEWGWLRQVQQFLASPNIAYILFTLGLLGLLYELASPGIGVAGIVGAVSLVLALFGMAVLPVNAAGVVLLLIAAGLFLAELFAPGIAGFAIGGGVVLVLAGVFLFDEAQGVRVDPMVALPTAVVIVVLAVIAGRIVYRTRHGSAATGTSALVGRTAQVGESEGDRGRIFMDGAWWAARSTGGPLSPGQDVRVTDVDGLTLVVEPLREDPSASDGDA